MGIRDTVRAISHAAQGKLCMSRTDSTVCSRPSITMTVSVGNMVALIA
jgi:hypothetical protein